MKPLRSSMTRLLSGLLVVSGIGLFTLAMLRPRPSGLPLLDAQLAGSRRIVLEDERPVYGFDDARLPIVVAPPPDGRWAAYAVGAGERRQLSVVAEPVDDRVRVRVQAPLPIGRWQLALEDRSRTALWPVHFETPPTTAPAIARLQALAEARPVEGRPAVWRSAIADLAPRARVSAHVEEARAWIAAGDLAAAARAYERAADAAGALGWVSEQAGRLRAAAWANLRLRRFNEAHRHLDRAEAVLEGVRDAWGMARLDYLRGCTLRKTGMFRASTRGLERSWVAARWFDDRRLSWIITDELASLYSELGRHAEALALVRALPPDGAERARRLSIKSWIATRAHRAQPERWPAIRADLLACLEIQHEPDARHIALTNLIELELLEGRLDDAAARLDEADGLAGAFAVGHTALLRAEVALRRADLAGARAGFERVYRATLDTLDDELRWQAAFGLFEVARRSQSADAGAWMTRALDAVERRVRQTAVSDARATTLADRRTLVDAAIRFHLAQGDPKRAFATLDAAHAWVLRDLEARTRVERLTPAARRAWMAEHARYQARRESYDTEVRRCDRRPTDEQAICRRQLRGHRKQVEAAFDGLYAVLDESAPTAFNAMRVPTLPAGHALFSTVALGDRHVGFWLEGAQVEAQTIQPGQPLAPFADRLAQLDHLYVVPGPGVDSAPVFEALAARRAALTWSEIPFAGLLTTPYISAGAPAVVLADPTSDLTHARAEGAAVHRRLGGQLLVGDAVTRQAALGALDSGARVVHFAGHGALDAESPWQAHLALADGERLTLADLLVAQPKAGVVVLSGCETGVRSALSTTYRVGLPDAFLLAGARAVIATNRVVPDADARAFIDLFYQSSDWAERPAAAFATAIRKMRAAGNPIWSAFRLMGRA